MQQQGGFTINCRDKESAKRIAELANAFLKDLGIDSWVDELEVVDDSVRVDYESYIDFDVFDGLFEKLCQHIEDRYPDRMVSGDARYVNMSTDYTWELSMNRTEDGIRISSEAVDWDAVFSMLDEGMSVEEVADIFGVDPSVIEAHMGYDEDEDEDEDY